MTTVTMELEIEDWHQVDTWVGECGECMSETRNGFNLQSHSDARSCGEKNSWDQVWYLSLYSYIHIFTEPFLEGNLLDVILNMSALPTNRKLMETAKED